MFGSGRSSDSSNEGEGRNSRRGWFFAVFATAVATVTVFYLASLASGAQQTRILDQGAHSDLQRIGREIDLRSSNLLQNQRFDEGETTAQPISLVLPEPQIDPENERAGETDAPDGVAGADTPGPSKAPPAVPAISASASEDDPCADAEFCLVAEDVEQEAENLEENDDGAQGFIQQSCVGQDFFKNPEVFGLSLLGLCEGASSNERGRFQFFSFTCEAPKTNGSQRCGFFTEKGARSGLRVEDLGLSRITSFAVYTTNGKLAAQIDGLAMMPAQMPESDLQRLASESPFQSEAAPKTFLSNLEASGDDAAEANDPITDREITIAGEEYRIYAIRLDNSQPIMVGIEPCEQRNCYLVGLSPVRGLWEDLTSLAPLTQLVFVAIIGLLILSIPVLKLATIGGNTAFNKTDIAVLALSIPLAAATATLVIAAHVHWYQIAQTANETVAAAALQIDKQITQSVTETRENQYRLIYGEDWKSPAEPQATPDASDAEASEEIDEATQPSDRFLNPLVIVADDRRGKEPNRGLYFSNHQVGDNPDPDDFAPPRGVVDRGYTRRLIAQDSILWPCSDLGDQPPGDYASSRLVLERNEDSIRAAETAPPRECQQIVSRQRSLAGGGIVSPGAKSTVVGLPAIISNGSEDPQEEPQYAALISPIVDDFGRTKDVRLAETVRGLGYAVIDSRNSLVLHHHQEDRELLESFNQEVDGYAGSWLDQLAKSMPDRCAFEARKPIPANETAEEKEKRLEAENREKQFPDRMIYQGKALNAVAVPNCETGWIVVTWWSSGELQFQAAETTIFAAALYLTFAIVAGVLIVLMLLPRWIDPKPFLAFLARLSSASTGTWIAAFVVMVGLVVGSVYLVYLIGFFPALALVSVVGLAVVASCFQVDLRQFWPRIDAPIGEVRRIKSFLWKGFLLLLGGTFASIVTLKIGAGAFATNCVLWLSLVALLALIWSLTKGRAQDSEQDSKSAAKFESHRRYRLWLTAAQLFTVLALAIAPAGVAYVSAADFRTQLRDESDGGLLTKALVEKRADILVVNKGTITDPEAIDEKKRFRKPEDINGYFFEFLMPRITREIELNGAVFREDDLRIERQKAETWNIASSVQLFWLFVIFCLLIGFIWYVLVVVQKAVFGIQHVGLPMRESDVDPLAFITQSIKDNEPQKYLIIDCDDNPRRQLQEARRDTQEIVPIDLALERSALTDLEPPSINRRIWFITNVDVVLSDPEIRARGLELLELLAARPEAEVYLFSEIPPLVRLRREREMLLWQVDKLGDDSKEAVELLTNFETEQNRWSRLLGDFQTVYCSAPGPTIGDEETFIGPHLPAVKRIHDEASRVRYKEAKAQLLRLAKDPHVRSWSEEQVTTRIQAEMAEYYERQWRICSRVEQLALLHLAEGNFLNITNFSVVGQLIQRGLIVRDPEFRVMNKSFENWVRTTDKSANFERFKANAQRDGTWRLLRLPIVIALVGAVSLLGYLNQENLEFMVALLPALLSGLPLVISAVLGGKPELSK